MRQALETATNRDILETVIDEGAFQTLVRALKISGLDEVLNNGGSYTVLMIHNAHVIKPGIECANGTVHVIDSVLLPQ
ncbi:MAG: fasciclin domain-containing protein [Endomicrobiales bacterium]